MRKQIVAAIVLALVMALAVPSLAFADKGGVPNEHAGSNASADKVTGNADTSKGQSEAAKAKEKAKGDSDEAKAKVKDKAKDKAASEESTAGDLPDGSEDASGTPAVKRHGVENALFRLQTNLARMQAQVDAGNRESLPPGLQRVIAKFMEWLGIAPDDGGEDPGDGSSEPTGTVEPTATVEPTGTLEPVTP